MGAFPFFGDSRVRRRILGLFFAQPGKAIHVRALARELGVVASVVGRELERLQAAGVLTSEWIGRARVYRLNDESAIARDAASLFEKTEGIEAVLRQAIGEVPGVMSAWLFGSHADRTERPGSDLDVLIIGTPSQSALSAALMPLEERLGRAIHTTSMSPAEFERRRHRPGFVASVLDRPRILLVGSEP